MADQRRRLRSILPRRRRSPSAALLGDPGHRLGLTLAVLDGAIANVALPTIARDLDASPAASIWVVNAYQLAVTISLLPLASLGDIYGYRRVYQYGLIVFTVASLGCALSDSLLTLTIARVIQGFGAAGIMSVNGALVRFIYPRRWLGRGVGLNATIGSIASAVGPTVAAGILSVAPVALAVRGERADRRAGHSDGVARTAAHAEFRRPLRCAECDLERARLRAAGQRDRADWAMARAPVYAGAELGLAWSFGFVLVTRQLARTSPMLPVDLLRIPLFALSVATSICSFVAQSMALVSLPFLFENTLGRSQVETGLLLTPGRSPWRSIAPFTGRLADRYPAGLLGGCGLAVMAAGLALLSLLPAHPAHVRHRLAHADLRHRLRLLQHAEQPRDHDRSTADACRCGERHAGDVAPAGPERGSGHGGADVRAVSARGHQALAGGRGLRRCRRGGGEFRKADTGVTLEHFQA